MFSYKDPNNAFVLKSSDQKDSLRDILEKINVNLEQILSSCHFQENNSLNQKLFYQIDCTLLFNPDIDLMLSVLDYFDLFCASKFPITLYPVLIYRQIIKIGFEKIYDSRVVSKVLSILFYICSSINKSTFMEFEVMPFVFQVIDFFYDTQLKKQGKHEEQFTQSDQCTEIIFDSDIAKNNELNKIDATNYCYAKCFNQAIIFLYCLASLLELNNDKFKNIIFKLFDVIIESMPESQKFNIIYQEKPNPVNFIEFSYIFNYVNIIIPHFHFSEDEMIQINHFLLNFLARTKMMFFDSSFLKTIYLTKSWHMNIFEIFDNDLLANYLKNCVLFFTQSYENKIREDDFRNRNANQKESEDQNLLYLLEYSLKNINKIKFSFPEIYNINFDLLKNPSIFFTLNSYLKCIEKHLNANIIPIDVSPLIGLSFNCLLSGEYKIQKSSIGVILALSKICINCFYKNIIENMDTFSAFVESGNIETTSCILQIFINTIQFCDIKDPNSFNEIIEKLIQQDFIQIIYDIFIEIDPDNIEIENFSKFINQYIQKYQQKMCDS